MEYLAIAFILFISCIVSGTRFERIKKYELVHLNVEDTASTKFIEFDAFNHHYHIELTPNHLLNPALIHHMNTNFDGLDDHFTSLNETCHYHGTVLDSDDSLVALSMCPRRGIEGTITAFDDEIEIAPTKSYFDHRHHHTTHDEHLVFKLSDYDEPIDDAHKTIAHRTLSNNKTHFEGSKRKLLRSNDNIIEHYILADYSMYIDYQDYYEESWRDELVNDLTNVMNGAAAIYTKNSKKLGIGNIYLSFKQFEAATSKSGEYNSLRRYRYGSGDSYRKIFKNWLSNSRGESHWKSVDASFLYTNKEADSSGTVGSMCSKATAAISVYQKDISSSKGRLHAHLIAFNLGADKEAYGSLSDSYFWGENNNDYFSYAAIDGIEYYYRDNDMSCLTGGNKDNTVVINGDNTVSVSSGGSSSDCVKISSLSIFGGQFNVEWKSDGTINGYKSYKADIKDRKISGYKTYYLFATKEEDDGLYWTIYTKEFTKPSWTFEYDYGLCLTKDVDILKCEGWDTDSSVTFSACGSFEDTLPCLADDPSDTMCVYSYHNKVWNMKLEETDCSFDKAIYEYYDEEREEMYYLHYDEYYKYDSDVELSAQWVISEGIADTNAYHSAFCEEKELMNCNGKWMVEEDEGRFVMNEHMVINQNCVAKERSNVIGLVIGLWILLIIILILFGIFFFWVRRRAAKLKKGVEVMDEEVLDDEEEMDDGEIDVEREVIMPTNTTD